MILLTFKREPYVDEFAELIALTDLQDNNGNYDLPQTFFQAASDLIVD